MKLSPNLAGFHDDSDKASYSQVLPVNVVFRPCYGAKLQPIKVPQPFHIVAHSEPMYVGYFNTF